VSFDGEVHVVLVEPEIPHNTGAIGRLCVATGATLHLVGRLGFHIDERSVRRAGLDYWQFIKIEQHPDFEAFKKRYEGPIYLYSARAKEPYTKAPIPRRIALVFGSETRGLPASLLQGEHPAYRIPIYDERVRSLNLATAVGIVLYDVVRQLDQLEVPES
jgi:tRNA (cytidine/uridine-2'-O-)-methyltransferase